MEKLHSQYVEAFKATFGMSVSFGGLDALLGKIPPFLEGVTMFHADYVNPKWDYSKLEFVTKIDDHLFYKET